MENARPVPVSAPDASIEMNGHIKAHFLGERMWVRVKHRDGNSATGILANEPFNTGAHGYREGDEVQIFKNGNIWEPRYDVKLDINPN